jgi:hypothetical protein
VNHSNFAVFVEVTIHRMLGSSDATSAVPSHRSRFAGGLAQVAAPAAHIKTLHADTPILALRRQGLN